MRMNLNARAVTSRCSDFPEDSILLTIRPACLLPGDFSYTTNLDSLLRMLRKRTDLPSTVLDKFENEIYSRKGANLLGIDLTENTLADIGYFVD
jgi:hypothetical protein